MTKETYSNYQYIQEIKPLLMPSWLQIQKSALWSEYWKKIRQKRPSREIHAFCIGLPKTGTHSIATMLECKTAHEPEKSILFDLYKAKIKGRISTELQVRVLRARDTMLWLDVESNWLLGLNLEALIKAFPKAKYILTVRSPLSWLDAQINEQYVMGNRLRFFKDVYEAIYGSKSHSQHDIVLSEYGLHSVAGYLSYWMHHHQQVLNLIPQQNLLVIKTQEISSQSSQISDFVGAKKVDLQYARSHVRKDKPLAITELVNQQYLEAQIEKYTASITHEINKRLNKINRL